MKLFHSQQSIKEKALSVLRPDFFEVPTMSIPIGAENTYSIMTFLGLTTLVLLNVDSLQAVGVADLRVPMQAMKTEVWSYLFPIKVAAVVVGSAIALTKQSLMPFGVGAGIGAAIQFFDSVLGDGSAALI